MGDLDHPCLTKDKPRLGLRDITNQTPRVEESVRQQFQPTTNKASVPKKQQLRIYSDQPPLTLVKAKPASKPSLQFLGADEKAETKQHVKANEKDDELEVEYMPPKFQDPDDDPNWRDQPLPEFDYLIQAQGLPLYRPPVRKSDFQQWTEIAQDCPFRPVQETIGEQDFFSAEGKFNHCSIYIIMDQIY